MKSKKSVSIRKKPSQDRSKDTVNIILKATTHIIDQVGVSGISTNKIAEKAGISIGSLYQYFPNKESILAKLMHDYLNKQHQLVSQALLKSDAKSLKEAIEVVLNVIIKSKSHQIQLNKLFIENFTRIGDIKLLQDNHKKLIEIFKLAITPYKNEVRSGDLELMLFNCIQSILMISVSTLFSKEYSIKDQKVKEEMLELVYRYLKA